MGNNLLAVPDAQPWGQFISPTIRTAPLFYQEIPSRCISVHQLAYLLQSQFPHGGYDVDVRMPL